jgi:CHAD domain-containing protein
VFSAAPQRLFRQAIHDLNEHLPGLRDGAEVAIHQSRVAIRRLRESFALVRDAYHHRVLDDVEERLGEVFKTLGRARDADSAQRLIQYVEARVPLASAPLGQMRATTAREQQAARRRLIKKLESVRLESALSQLMHARHRRPLFGGDGWRATVQQQMRGRGGEALHAMERAGGVYFPKRSHTARVAIKRFRYAVELAESTGLRTENDAVRVLRKAQNALGEAHDREVLIKKLAKVASDDNGEKEVLAVEQFLDGEIASFHQKYLSVRPRIAEIAIGCQATARLQLPLRASAMAIAALALPVVLAQRKGGPP